MGKLIGNVKTYPNCILEDHRHTFAVTSPIGTVTPRRDSRHGDVTRDLAFWRCRR